jgi:hypothetical protein
MLWMVAAPAVRAAADEQQVVMRVLWQCTFFTQAPVH